MKIIATPSELKNYLSEQNKTIGFIPTMGALHEGHITLIRKARAQNELLVVSIFVNPTQFLAGEDLHSYPRRHEADTKICELSGVDVLFLPQADAMYQKDEVSVVAPNMRGYVLEGNSRPGHFSGVLTVVMKLLNIVAPHKAYFGKKDAQQLYLIKLMVAQMFMDVEIVAVDTVREADGLALSSRNTFLSPQERKEALKISESLYLASKLVSKRIVDIDQIKTQMRELLQSLEIEYIEILNRDFEYIKEIDLGNTIVLVEAKSGGTRLLDNIWL